MIVIIDAGADPVELRLTPALREALARFAGDPGVKACPDYLRSAWAEAQR